MLVKDTGITTKDDKINLMNLYWFYSYVAANQVPSCSPGFQAKHVRLDWNSGTTMDSNPTIWLNYNPKNPEEIYADRVWASTDNGATWTIRTDYYLTINATTITLSSKLSSQGNIAYRFYCDKNTSV